MSKQKKQFSTTKLRRLINKYNSLEADGGSDAWMHAHDALQDYMFDHIDTVCTILEVNRIWAGMVGK